MKNLSVLTQRTLIVTSTTTIDAVSLPSIGIGSHQIKRTHIAWIWMKINKIGKMGFSIWNRELQWWLFMIVMEEDREAIQNGVCVVGGGTTLAWWSCEFS
ncbi:unnamed protein product [Lactuca virosa]|uniref:Uncharacterized protein n=1 Tax=Lactuca virosa TaxID=75947 RepID=A0AAU9MXD7_9ASTR|nr:unnamed protein product [Lactuca virosa]